MSSETSTLNTNPKILHTQTMEDKPSITSQSSNLNTEPQISQVQSWNTDKENMKTSDTERVVSIYNLYDGGGGGLFTKSCLTPCKTHAVACHTPLSMGY